MANERDAMYMPVPKPGEGSSSGPSDADVLKAVELLQSVAMEIEAATKSKQDETRATADSSDSDDLFEENETTILMRRITVLEEDKIFKDAQITSLMEELVVNNQKIHELETNLGALSVVVMDMKQKLEGKFPKDFVDTPKETTAEEREKERKEHEDAMNRYFENPPRTANQKPRKKMVVMRNVGAERDQEFGDRSDRYARVNFKDMKLAQSTIEEDEEVLNPASGKPYKNVRWPATKQTNIVPLLKELPDNSLKDLKFWMYDPLTSQVVIVCENTEYRFMDTKDLMCFGENDINLLAKTQIQSDPQHEVMAKMWTGGVAQTCV
ncbi:hypothetical protein Hanom_Chr09g00800541 [Helianthus anomalus]